MNVTGGLYFHIPFCLSKCDYCDFVSFSGLTCQKRYVNALLLDVNRKVLDFPLTTVSSIYFGGGTPSLLPASEIARILERVKKLYSIADGAEITLEVNPRTINEEKLLEYKKMGINRISVGVQSFSVSELEAVSRSHSPIDAEMALEVVSKIFENFSVDLMLGLPYSKMESVEHSLKKALSFTPCHISLYGLQLEKGTKLFDNVKEKKVVLPPSDEVTDMFMMVEKTLKEKGYSHYEISNFAKAGFESKHNLSYWNQDNYIGVGISSHSLYGNYRFFTTSDISLYMKNVENSVAVETLDTLLSKEDMEKEFIMLKFRLSNGISFSQYKEKFKENFQEKYFDEIESYKEYFIITKEYIAIKEEYFYISNSIIVEFM